jgi:hypothetical protein
MRPGMRMAAPQSCSDYGKLWWWMAAALFPKLFTLAGVSLEPGGMMWDVFVDAALDAGHARRTFPVR